MTNITQLYFLIRFLPPAFLIGLLVLTHIFILNSCASSQELTRAKAQKMIVESNEFKQPLTLEFIQMYIKDGQGTTEAKSDDEPESEAIQRRIQEYFGEAPQVGVADYFGLVKPELKRINDKPYKPSSLRGYWNFNERYVVTEKGRKMWENLGLPINETAVPLAAHDFLEITGITKQGENNSIVEFKWKWNPNEIGQSLDQSTEEYKKLPENLKKNLNEVNPYISPERFYSWEPDKSRQGKAMFQKYDDGWRLTSLGLF
ncbi:MAG: hypothetical protein LUM44_07900 [Pyrinomonadaceae bacterium]|nr:hypothetical protein [Pyrinomonadaceae bacterium]